MKAQKFVPAEKSQVRWYKIIGLLRCSCYKAKKASFACIFSTRRIEGFCKVHVDIYSDTYSTRCHQLASILQKVSPSLRFVHWLQSLNRGLFVFLQKMRFLKI